MGRSEPVAVSIPAIGVSSRLLRVGRSKGGRVQVPPDKHASRAAWFDESPTPGEAGPAIILGHVDSSDGPAVFYDLAKLRRGDKITVDRANGTTAVFRVDRTTHYRKETFPTFEVYGNIDHAGLRLITCGGTFDPDDGGYTSNTVTYASLVAHRPDQPANTGSATRPRTADRTISVVLPAPALPARTGTGPP